MLNVYAICCSTNADCCMLAQSYLQVNGDVGTFGISGHAADALGDVVFVDLPSVGSEVTLKYDIHDILYIIA
jgi:glycine cleavage system H lipoate-binding protein